MKQRPPSKTIAVSQETLQKAASQVSACDKCGTGTFTPFKQVLDTVIGSQGMTNYLSVRARCPRCFSWIHENTLVETGPAERLLKEFEPPLADTEIVFVDDDVLLEAQDLMTGCERCADYAEIACDYLLDALTGSDPTKTEYLLPRPAHCPHCSAEVTEKTLVTS
jgi:hypothetical protein